MMASSEQGASAIFKITGDSTLVPMSPTYATQEGTYSSLICDRAMSAITLVDAFASAADVGEKVRGAAAIALMKCADVLDGDTAPQCERSQHT